jgi:hypothetical protein
MYIFLVKHRNDITLVSVTITGFHFNDPFTANRILSEPTRVGLTGLSNLIDGLTGMDEFP